MIAAQRGGHQRLPGLRAGGNLRRGAGGLLVQGLQLVKLAGDLFESRLPIVRLAKARAVWRSITTSRALN
jgi:hypothetical protein